MNKNTNYNGLTAIEAKKSQEINGYNELPTVKKKTFFITIIEVLKEPMFALLLVTAFLYLLLGDHVEALALLGAVILVTGITIYQEQKTEKALDALRSLSSPKALVIRDGNKIKIPGRDVVVGDILVVSEGDRIPADAAVLEVNNLLVDESLLTGESVPVNKKNWSSKDKLVHPGGDGSSFVYAGTMAVKGQALARVLAIGSQTEMGKIGKALEIIEVGETDLQKQTKSIVKKFALVGILMCLVVVFGYSLAKDDWLGGILAGLALAMSALPEELPVVMTIFLALGAWRMSRKNVLSRRVVAIETLGATTVLCVDKTGTLTLNLMRVAMIGASGKINKTSTRLDANQLEVLRFGFMATPDSPFDPMEKAIKVLAQEAKTDLVAGFSRIREYPISDNFLAMSYAWQGVDKKYLIASKGSPEAIWDLCHVSVKAKEQYRREVEQMAEKGLRVLGVARAVLSGKLPTKQHDFEFEFVGLLGFEDPVRPEVPQAVAECRSAGIRVVMITGDYPTTALSIAKQAGFGSKCLVMTGEELATIDDFDLKKRIEKIDIFARTIPEQKLRIVNALKEGGQIVAMTGDGVNDAPALRAADIGVAMGGRGTDVAREAGSLILLDDNFNSIVAAVKMGRRIYDNLKKAVSFIFSVHVPIIGITVMSVLFDWPLVLLPLHIAFLELIIDPACSVVFEMEPAEKDVMRRRPRSVKNKLFSGALMWRGVAQGVVVLLVIAGVFINSLPHGEAVARTLAFSALVIGNLGLIYANRFQVEAKFNHGKNPAFAWIIAGTLSFLALVLFVPNLRELFHFSEVVLTELLLVSLLPLLALFLFEIVRVTLVKKNVN